MIKAHLVSRGKIKIYIGCILCFSFIWNFPKWFALGWVEGKNLPEHTDLAESYSYNKIYLTWLEKVVLEFVIPLATLTVLNILLLKTVSIIFTGIQSFKAFLSSYPHHLIYVTQFMDPKNEKKIWGVIKPVMKRYLLHS